MFFIIPDRVSWKPNKLVLAIVFTKFDKLDFLPISDFCNFFE